LVTLFKWQVQWLELKLGCMVEVQFFKREY